MGKAPAVVFIARHGARLDAEDKQWTANSPAPYDTPLSYGGWTQTRALGARIASLLHAREMASVEDAGGRRNSDSDGLSGHAGTTSSPKRRKQRVVIHTSPFLRCVQSSIAVAAGMAQYTGNLNRFEVSNEARSTPATFRRGPGLSASQSRAQTLDQTSFEERYDVPAGPQLIDLNRPRTSAAHGAAALPEISKPTLRVDAFLGEWLSPDYFEFITPPPSSNMMVAAAKADLLRSAEPIHGAKLEVLENYPPQSWAGWGQYLSSISDSPTSAFSMEGLAQTLPSNPDCSKTDTPGRAPLFGYAPPTPLYALSHSEPIPSGYVAHARDACVKVDFQWDSMRPPQNFGDGGEHGEEWSAMHNRFRQGVRSMVEWYKAEDANDDPQSNDPDRSRPQDEEEEVILVMLTHGAGCNALIGALTNQPVLMDVGMASLTMAVHKNRYGSASSFRRPSLAPNSPSPSRRRSSIDIGLSTQYEMKLIASVEHLRAGADPLKIPQLQVSSLSSIAEGGRRGSKQSPSSSGAATPVEIARSRNSALGSIRRSTVNSRSSRSYTGMSAASQRSSSPVPISQASGLWTGGRQSSTATIDDEAPPSPSAGMFPDFNNGQVGEPNKATEEPSQGSRSVWQPKTSSALSRAGTVGHGGLWGAPPASLASPRARSATISEKL